MSCLAVWHWNIFMMMLMMYYLDKHIYDIMLFLLASILWNKLNMNLPNFLTFQKCEFRQFSSVGFAGMLKPPPFEGTHYKRWRQKTILWLSSMRCFYVVNEIPPLFEPLMSNVSSIIP